jgi:transposase-like protein
MLDEFWSMPGLSDGTVRRIRIEAGRGVDHEGEVLESYVTKRRDRKAALRFLMKSMKRYGQPNLIGTDKLRSYGAAMKAIGNADSAPRILV